ncbi:hypothetical protein LTR97_003587 [Elasticomyces elasticus]|uniref:Zn(2)-C6 fungal-type domain-containing protein n=1 Tax=Elasticomyces elasticus TaxID=574655 RepID=A0AAN7W9B0_9PEZI|nr:hypothetical protein LTR97_003587 [Elasticomyces elasticus]
MDTATGTRGGSEAQPGVEVKSRNSGNGHPRPKAAAKGASRRPGKHAVDESDADAKRRCVSTACIACRKRKSKCDGALPACAACLQVYGTNCIYDPNSDHRRKGVYKNDIADLKTRETTLQTLIEAILNSPEEDVPALVQEIRTCESLDAVAERIKRRDQSDADREEDDASVREQGAVQGRTFETQLYGKMGDLRLDDGSVRYIGGKIVMGREAWDVRHALSIYFLGTSNLIHLASDESNESIDEYSQQEDPITSWTNVTDDPELVVHLLNMYFTWWAQAVKI